MRIEVREVQIADHIQAVQALLAANWAETGFDFPLAVDWARYCELQAAGVAIAVAAFDDQQIVGYSTAFITPQMFNPQEVACMSDALFVAPEYRKCSASFKLIQATERLGLARGARHMLWGTRAGTPFARMLAKRGYTEADVVMARRMSDG